MTPFIEVKCRRPDDPDKSPCYSCVHAKEWPGNCHIRCARGFDEDADPDASLIVMLSQGSVGVRNLPADFKVEGMCWPGGGVWPSMFDANRIVRCEGFTAKENP